MLNMENERGRLEKATKVEGPAQNIRRLGKEIKK